MCARIGEDRVLVKHCCNTRYRLRRFSDFVIFLASLPYGNFLSVRLLEKNGFSQWEHVPVITNFNGMRAGQYVYARAIDNGAVRG